MENFAEEIEINKCISFLNTIQAKHARKTWPKVTLMAVEDVPGGFISLHR